MSKSIKFKNNNYLDSSSIVHNRELLKDFLNKSNVLYSSSTGITADASGNSVVLEESVTKFSAILIISSNGGAIVDSKLNQTNYGYGISIFWFGEGYQGTFYNNTIYKVIGIGRI